MKICNLNICNQHFFSHVTCALSGVLYGLHCYPFTSMRRLRNSSYFSASQRRAKRDPKENEMSEKNKVLQSIS